MHRVLCFSWNAYKISWLFDNCAISNLCPLETKGLTHTYHSKRRTRKGTALPSSPATLGLGKIPLTISICVSGPSRSSNTKCFTRINSTICINQRQEGKRMQQCHRHRKAVERTLNSAIAKPFPRHVRGPSMKVSRCRCPCTSFAPVEMPSSSVHRSGLNSLASAPHSAVDRFMDDTETVRYIPFPTVMWSTSFPERVRTG